MINTKTIPLSRTVDLKKFQVLLVVTTLLLAGTFGFFYTTSTTAPGSANIAPGRLGAPTFSHYIYGGFGEDALHKPMFATFGNDRVYVSDTNNFRVQVFAEDGTPLFKFGERGNKDGQFYYPYGIVTDSEGFVYVADMYRSNIQVFTPEGEYVRTFADKDSALDGPAAMYLDDKGRLFVANVNAANVVVFDLTTGEHIQTIGLPNDLFAPNAVSLDQDGYIYVVDTGRQRVVVYSPDGSRPVRLINGSGDGRGTSLLMNPRGIGIRGDWIFVVSNMTHTIHAFDKKGQEVFAFGKQGDKHNEFMHPNGLTVDSRGRILITDTVGGRVAVYK